MPDDPTPLTGGGPGRAWPHCVEYRKALRRGYERERALREAAEQIVSGNAYAILMPATSLETGELGPAGTCVRTGWIQRARFEQAQVDMRALVAALEPTDPAPSTTEGVGGDEPCEHDFQMHPGSDDFGVCSKCGAEQADDPGDDATHIVIGKSETTLCGQDAGPRSCVPLSMVVPGWGAGCWTCLERAREAYEAIGKPPATEGAREGERDDREWTAVGEQAGAARAGETMWSGPYLKPGERVTVIPKAEHERQLRLAARAPEQLLDGERPRGPNGEPLCFTCRKPQSGHPNGEECRPEQLLDEAREGEPTQAEVDADAARRVASVAAGDTCDCFDDGWMAAQRYFRHLAAAASPNPMDGEGA